MGMEYHQQQQQQMREMPPQQMQQYMPLQQQGSGPAVYAQSPVAGGPDPNGPNRALYIGNLAKSVDEAALQETFGAFGPIMHIQVGSNICVGIICMRAQHCDRQKLVRPPLSQSMSAMPTTRGLFGIYMDCNYKPLFEGACTYALGRAKAVTVSCQRHHTAICTAPPGDA
jgi:hypothetical protein